MRLVATLALTLLTTGCASAILGPKFGHNLPIRIHGEQLALDCRRDAEGGQCDFAVDIEIHNQGDHSVTATIGFGNTSRSTYSGFELDGHTLQPRNVRSEFSETKLVIKGAFEPGASSRLVATGTISLANLRSDMAGIQVRHYLLGSNSYRHTYRVHYDAPDPRVVTAGYALSADVTHPGWAVHTTRRDRGLVVGLDAPSAFITLGGPSIGAGIVSINDGSMRRRIRAGYDLAVFESFIVAANAETDFSTATVVPTVELTGPWALESYWIPALGLGIGAPVQLHPIRTAGLRYQATLALPYVTISGTYDDYPAIEERRLGLMLSVSL